MDETYQIDVMNKLREVYPNIVEIKYRKDEQVFKSESNLRKISEVLEPFDICLNFMEFCSHRKNTEEEKKIIRDKINYIKNEM